MGNWISITTVTLCVAIVVVSVAIFFIERSNINLNQKNIIYPFSASIKPGQTNVQLLNSLGTSQIDCSSVGGKINIIGAWSEVIDPYGTCTGTSAGALNLTCGLKGPKLACKADSDCGPGMSCAGGICVPATCPVKNDGSMTFDSNSCSCGGNYCPVQPGKPCTTVKDCNDTGTLMYCDTSTGTGTCAVNPGQTCMAPDPFSGQYCALYPLCSNMKLSSKPGNLENSVCGPDNKNINGGIGCRPRDASAYLAGLCDGQSTCNLTFDPTQQLSGFGTIPCDMSVTPPPPGGGGLYNDLPMIPGQGGNYNQGYYVHGIYTCTFN